MQAVLLVIHVIIALALIGIILIQRSDSDGFGLGSGSGSNFMTGRSAASFLTRTTAILATLFILNSLVLGIIASRSSGERGSIMDTIKEQEEQAGSDASEETKAATEKGAEPANNKEKAATPAKKVPAQPEPSVPTE